MEKSRYDDLEACLMEELEKDEMEIDVDKLKLILDQLAEKNLTGKQKQGLADVYKKLEKQVVNEQDGSL